MSVNQSFSRALTNPHRDNIVNKLRTCRREVGETRLYIYIRTHTGRPRYKNGTSRESALLYIFLAF